MVRSTLPFTPRESYAHNVEDLLIAFAKALSRIATNPSPDAGVFIVPTTNEAGQHPGWEDRTSVKEVKSRLSTLMKTMAAVGTLPATTDSNAVDAIIDAKFQVKRVLTNSAWFKHCKDVCVDCKVLYVDSDNTYPNYDEEHGCWIEEPANVRAWLSEFYAPLWERSTVATD